MNARFFTTSMNKCYYFILYLCNMVFISFTSFNRCRINIRHLNLYFVATQVAEMMFKNEQIYKKILNQKVTIQKIQLLFLNIMKQQILMVMLIAFKKIIDGVEINNSIRYVEYKKLYQVDSDLVY